MSQFLVILSALASVSPRMGVAQAIKYAEAVDAVVAPKPEEPFHWGNATFDQRCEKARTMSEVMDNLPDRKILAIKALRTAAQPYLGLKEAKDVVDSISPPWTYTPPAF